MAASRRPPHADDPNCGGGGTASSETSLDSEGSDGDSAVTSLLNPRGSSKPTGYPTIDSDDEKAASKSDALLLTSLGSGQPTQNLSLPAWFNHPFPFPNFPSPPPAHMAAPRRSHDADDPNCGGGRSASSETFRDSEGPDGASAATSLLRPRCSSNPTGYRAIGTDYSSSSSYDEDAASKFAALLLTPHGSDHPTGGSVDNSDERSYGTDDPTVGASSSSALGYHDDEDPAAKASASLPLRSLDWSGYECDDESGESWFSFSDRMVGGASTSTSSPDAYDCPSYWNAHDQVLESYFSWNDYEIPQNSSCKILEKAPFASKAVVLESQVMKYKIKMLLADYPEYRPICPDGNCFYRSFIYSYLEQLMEVSLEEELHLLRAIVPMEVKSQRSEWSHSFPDLYEAFQCFILECMRQKQILSVKDWLLQKCGNVQKSVKILSYLRLVAAIEMCSDADFFGPFLQRYDFFGHVEVIDYCRMRGIPMQHEADHCIIIALARVLEVPVQVVSIDSNPNYKPSIRFLWELPNSPSVVPTVTLLVPGHYDILYPK